MIFIKGTPAYWKKSLDKVLAMAKHLFIPKFFLTLTCADQVEWINYDYFKADFFTYFNGRYLENVLLGKERIVKKM